MTEALFKKYMEQRGGEVLGDPISVEQVTKEGRYRDFQWGSIYWSVDTGSYVLKGEILKAWRDRGAESSPLGYPISDEQMTPDGSKNYTKFQNGIISYTPQSNEIYVSTDDRMMQRTLRVVGTALAIISWLLVAALIAELSDNHLLGVLTALLGPLTALVINLLWGKQISVE